MTSALLSFILDIVCLGLSLVFFWSTFVVLIGLIKPAKRHPHAERKLKFAVLVCARNEVQNFKKDILNQKLLDRFNKNGDIND